LSGNADYTKSEHRVYRATLLGSEVVQRLSLGLVERLTFFEQILGEPLEHIL
jgi:hypothetical protein